MVKRGVRLGYFNRRGCLKAGPAASAAEVIHSSWGWPLGPFRLGGCKHWIKNQQLKLAPGTGQRGGQKGRPLWVLQRKGAIKGTGPAASSAEVVHSSWWWPLGPFHLGCCKLWIKNWWLQVAPGWGQGVGRRGGHLGCFSRRGRLKGRTCSLCCM